MIFLRWSIATLVVFGGAWMFRYEPLPTDNSLRAIVVWDRWTQQQCIFIFAENRGLHCSMESLSGKPKANWESDPIVEGKPKANWESAPIDEGK